MNISEKKVLIIGGINYMAELLNIAHRNYIKVGVTDYNKDTYLKRNSDFVHNINAVDVEKLHELVIQEKYDGIISNFNDMLSPYVTELADKVGMHVPYTIEQLKLSTDKKYFKNVCIKYGIKVPTEYRIEAEVDSKSLIPSDIVYPIIIKPVDGSGSKGISICNNDEELTLGIEKAKNESKSGDIVIEQYISDDEINVTYIAQDGDIQLAAIHDRYFNTSQKGAMKVPDLYIYPSRHTDNYIKNVNPLVINMLKDLGIKNGSLFMQACVKDDEVFFYEAGMRLNGCCTFQILEVENDYNTLEHLLYFSLTGTMGEKCQFSPKFKHWYATINVLGKPGSTINHFKGIEEIYSYPWLIHAVMAYREGEKIPENSAGTLIQDTTRIHIVADTKEQLIKRIAKVNELYQLIDDDGNNIVLRPHDLNEVFSRLDYEL